jgi:hypothetical protein
MDEAKFKLAKQDMTNLTEARINFFAMQMRAADNEWMLEEMFEFGDEVQATYSAMLEAQLVEKHEYQEIVAIARMGWAELKLTVDKVEAICRGNHKVS